ncbi:U8 snoRNA-decapping enzyme [Thalassophryne amazonica]|uniref:U8 snoRNA-decapping enzyme n=1 Tax=Thalassophryne amazonica TaxID=390379 RepID=UPI001471F1DF|nr:U8 snoRNA-decapping enzyme [Thalassophryne amazonica]
MASGQMSRAEALSCSGCRHACHVMLYSDTKSQLFGRIPFKHIILMQMRFDGLLGFPGGLVDLSKETLEVGLSRELLEEVGVELPISIEDHVASCYAPTSSPSISRLVLHFYVKKMEEEEIKEVERAAVSTATDHGHEVLGMVRVPLYILKRGGGLPFFLSHAFIGNARSQLIDSLVRFKLVSPELLHRALKHSHTSEDPQAASAWPDAKTKQH